MTYFTSDQHFGHFNIIRLCQRPFESVEEMDEVMLAKWNAKVEDSDRVFILGDLFFRARDPEITLRRLKGRKTLILCNHDSSWTGKVELSRYFEGVHTMLETTDGEHAITLCHYPLMTFNYCMRAYMLHGHIHGNTNADHWSYLQSHDRILNASVEVNNYEPVTFAELLAYNQRYKAEHPEITR
jgi:calcineurin-like phosphoesterase family protein